MPDFARIESIAAVLAKPDSTYPTATAKQMIERKARLQALVEKIHRSWPIDRDYMPPPTSGELVALDPALFVTPPPGLEVGYVPIVTRQENAPR